MNPRIVRYRRRSELCADCGHPIDHEPNHGGDVHGWEPSCGVCLSCYHVDLFGAEPEPTPEWWRKVRRLLRAAATVAALNESTLPDLDLDF